MAKNTLLQIKAIFIKNFICSKRNKELTAEIVLPFIAAIFISLKDQLNFLAMFAPLFLAIAINSAARSLLIHLVEEKNLRFKETQKVQQQQNIQTIRRQWVLGRGLTPLDGYYMDILRYLWYIFIMNYSQGTIILLLSWLIFNKIINQGDFGMTTSFGNLAGVYWIYACATLNQSLMLTTIFSTPKLASEVTTFLTVMTTLLTFLLFLDSLKSAKLFYIGLSLFPNSAMSFAYISVLKPSLNQIYPSAEVHAAYPLETAAIQLALEAVVFFILYFYLDQVFPNEYGVAKHPLFFILDPYKAFKKKNQKVNADLGTSLLNEGDQSLDIFGNTEDMSSAIYHQKLTNSKKTTVVIRNLVKTFGSFTAVDNVSINLYENEILCLLGHNGAGKTTTISVLIGLLSRTSGQVTMQGYDLAKNLDKIREIIGICSQRDVLYDELTVEEQLLFMGQVKGMEGTELKNDVESILETTKLCEERSKLTKELSGGTKRKLSLAMALIGGSQIIFLDEPTSGMDAMSRPIIWEILERVKCNGRTLVLTTHHLDEAEILADRIAIMAAGKLLACGKSDYIKVNFGEGYQLQIKILAQDVSKTQIISMVAKELSMAVNDPQSASNSLLFIVPFKAKSQLKVFFQKLEAEFNDGVQVNLKMNSLEDAFVNIGMDEKKFMEKARRSLIKGSKGSLNDEEEKQQDDEEMNNDKEARQIDVQVELKIPDCLNRPPVYIFKQQFLAIFLRKWYTTIRTFSNYVAIIVPFALIIIGTAIINQITISGLSDEAVQFFKLVMVCVFVILAFSFNSSMFISLPVLERETNLKYALNVMGCRVLPYWIGTFVFDYLLFYVFVLIFIMFSYIMKLDFLTEYMGLIVLIFSAFGLSYVSFSYLCGVAIYEKTSSAMKTFPLLNFFIIYSMPWNLWGVVNLIQEKADTTSLDFLLLIVEWIGCLCSPFYTFNLAFQYIKVQNLRPGARQPPFISTSSYFYTGMLFVQFVIFSLLTLYMENRKYSKLEKQTQNKQSFKRSQRVDEAVIEEERRMQICNDPVKVASLQKVYDNGFVALKDVSFGVQQEQIIGLLGPNGAGKSTMFNVVTSLINKSSGSVKIFNTEVNRNETEIFKNVGICPQFDCIWENLTPVEHLYLFGRMKGLSGKDLDESVEYFIKTMQLDEYVKRKAGRLSGGNKRKLCVSNALIGGPCIQFFDEPSTGVDPIARRFLWRTLKKGVQLRNSSVVITTHTMDEAESLCDKIAILVNGQFYCFGSPQELRDEFGEGYNITVKGLKEGAETVVLEAIRRQFPSLRILEDKREDYFTVHIPTEEFKFYRAFELLQTELVEQKLITDFSINQSSLESVFIYFTKQQNRDEQGANQNLLI